MKVQYFFPPLLYLDYLEHEFGEIIYNPTNDIHKQIFVIGA